MSLNKRDPRPRRESKQAEEEASAERRAMDESSSYGGGGKLKKRSLRSRAPSTPYDRPPLAEKKGGWFSKLLVRPASRILPSLFPSSSFSSSSQHQDQDRDQVQEQSPVELEQERATVTTLTSNNQKFEPKESDASAETRQPKVDSGGEGPVGYTFTDLGIAEIERQLQQKKFSRDETNHLIELLRSRTTDLSDDGGHASGLKLEASEVTLGQKDLRKSTKEDYSMQFNLTRQQKSSDHFQIATKDASSSPIEIAKAYMEARTSASSYDCQSGRLKNEKSVLCTDNAVSKLSFTPVAKSPMCWPGAVMQSDHGYYTPQRGSVVCHPRTPYSGALFSKSTSKLQASVERPNRSSAARSSTHVFGRNMTPARTNSILDDGVTPFSPIHNIRQKNISHISKGAGPSSPATSFSLQSKSDASRGFSSASERDSSSKGVFSKFQQADVVDEASTFASAFTPVHPQSSVMARKILEHLDRSVPSPKEKLLEINLARKKLPPKSETPITGGQHERSDASISDKLKTGYSLGRDLVSQEIVDAQKVLSGKSSSMFSDKDQLSSLPQTSKQGVAQSTAAASSAPFQMPKSRFSSSEASIPATKPSEKLKICDNGFSFTFPVTGTPAAFSEPPPTPTMASPSATTSRMLDASEASIPSFSFGSDKSSSRIVFSFGSAVSSSDIDATTPSFKFGSENESRLSFKVIDKDAICY